MDYLLDFLFDKVVEFTRNPTVELSKIEFQSEQLKSLKNTSFAIQLIDTEVKRCIFVCNGYLLSEEWMLDQPEQPSENSVIGSLHTKEKAIDTLCNCFDKSLFDDSKSSNEDMISYSEFKPFFEKTKFLLDEEIKFQEAISQLEYPIEELSKNERIFEFEQAVVERKEEQEYRKLMDRSIATISDGCLSIIDRLNKVVQD
jgi:hypothetical protein